MSPEVTVREWDGSGLVTLEIEILSSLYKSLYYYIGVFLDAKLLYTWKYSYLFNFA